jgi:hypothetical protein
MITLQFSTYNERKGTFDNLNLDQPLGDMSDEQVTEMLEDATSVSAFYSSVEQEDDAFHALDSLKTMLDWKGEVSDTPTSWENETRKGKIRSGFVIQLQKVRSRRIDATAFVARLAGLPR